MRPSLPAPIDPQLQDYTRSHLLAQAKGQVKTEVLFVRRPVERLQRGHASVAVTPLIIAVHQHGFQGGVTAPMASTRIQGRVASALELHAEVVGRGFVDHLMVACGRRINYNFNTLYLY